MGLRQAADVPAGPRHRPPRARDGAAIIISSHLLHLVEEICSNILILKQGRKIIDGTMEEITQKFSEQPGDASLEEVFFRATEQQIPNVNR